MVPALVATSDVRLAQEPASQGSALKVPGPIEASLQTSSQPSARSFKRFIPFAAIFLCAAVGVAAGYQYVPRIVERVLGSLRSAAPKPATPTHVLRGGVSQPVAQKPHPGVPAQPAPAPDGGEVPGQSTPTAQTQPGEPARPTVVPAQSPEGAGSQRATVSEPPSIAGNQPNQPPPPANPAAPEKPPVIVAFTSSAQSIERGSSATLHWSVAGDNPSVTLLPGIGALPPAGTWEVKPETTQQFTLTAISSSQSFPEIRRIVIVVVPHQAPRIVSFTADASQVRFGQTIVLRWTVSGASALRIDPGIGPVSSSGALVVRPLSDTAYTLSASGPGGTTKGTVPINVLAPAPAAGYANVPAPRIVSPNATPISQFQKDPGALRLLALVQAAMGGRRNLEAIHDWQRVDRVSWDVNGGTTYETTTFVAPSTIRVQSQGGSTTLDFSNGESGWTWSSMRPARNNLPSSTATSMPFRSLPGLSLSDGDPQRSVTLAGPSTLLIADSHNDRVWLRVNPFTHLPQSIAWLNADGSELEESYWNWHQNAGVMWWSHMSRSRNRQEVLRADAIGVRVDQGWTAQQMASATP